MSITDELREWAKGSTLSSWTAGHLTAIADRIDAEHERAMEERADRYAELRASLKERYIELPKDADGEYIHVGDEMEFSAFEVEKPVTRTVDGIGQGVFFAWCGERGYQQHEAKCYRHHHAPTVEDVLREFANECLTYATCVDDHEVADAIELYAAKLRLADVEDA